MRRLLLLLALLLSLVLPSTPARAQLSTKTLASATQGATSETELTDLSTTLTVADATTAWLAVYTLSATNTTTHTVQVTLRLQLDGATAATQVFTISASSTAQIVLPKTSSGLSLGAHIWRAFVTIDTSSGVTFQPDSSLFVGNLNGTVLFGGFPVIPGLSILALPTPGTTGRLARVSDGAMSGSLVIDQAGAWRCLDEGETRVVNVYCPSYGAKGDYPTTDDTTALRAAITQAQVLNGTVFLPAGTYKVTDVLAITNQKISIIGESAEATIIRIPNTFNLSATGVFDLAAGFRELAHLTILFDQPDSSSLAAMVHYPPAIKLNTGSGLKIDDVRIQLAWDGIQGLANPGAFRLTRTDIGAFHIGLDLDNAQASVFLNDYSFGGLPSVYTANQRLAEQTAATIGLQAGRVDDLKLSNGVFYVGQGMRTYISANGSTFGEIATTDFDSFNGLLMQGGSLTIASSHFTIAGNANTKSIRMDTAASSLAVAGSSFSSSVSAPTSRFVDLACPAATGCQVVLSGDTFSSQAEDHPHISATGGAAAEARLIVESSAFTRQNIALTTPLIDIASSFVYATIIGNGLNFLTPGNGDFFKTALDIDGLIAGNRLGGYRLNLPVGHSLMVRHNKGWITEKSGTASIASGSTSVVVTHGLSVTPTAKDLLLTLTNQPTVNPLPCSTGTYTATQFTVTCAVNPGSGGANFAWQAAIY